MSIKAGVMTASKVPSRKRQMARPTKFLAAAVHIRIVPHEMTNTETTVPVGRRWARYDAGHSATEGITKSVSSNNLTIQVPEKFEKLDSPR